MRGSDYTQGQHRRDPSAPLDALDAELARAFGLVDGLINRPFSPHRVFSQYTAKPWDFVFANVKNGSYTVLLPDPRLKEVSGTIIAVKSGGTSTGNLVTVRAIAGLIDGVATATIDQRVNGLLFLSDGLQWRSIAVSGHHNNNVRLLSTLYDPVGLWHAHLGIGVGFLDYSGNGNHLSLETGTQRYTALTPWMGGFQFDGSTTMYVSTYQSAIALAGAMTLQVLCTLTALPSAGFRFLVSHMASGETEATNSLYGLGVDTTNGFFYDHEHGAGVNAPLTGHVGSSWLPLHHVAIVGFTRTAGGVVQQYLNGRAYDSPTAALTLPTGGTSGRFRVGGVEGGSRWAGIVTSVKLVARELTAQEMINEYNFTLGRAYGWKVL